MSLLRDNDQQAYAALYERYSQDVFAYAVTLVKIREMAEDLLQDVFIKVWDAREKIFIEKSFRSYLFRICHNRAYDIHREISKDRTLLSQLVSLYRQDFSPDDEEPTDIQSYAHLMEDALNSMTPQRRRIYEMCKKEKKSYDDVARELNISPNTVRNHMTQTLFLLREYVRTHSKVSVLLFLLAKEIL